MSLVNEFIKNLFLKFNFKISKTIDDYKLEDFFQRIKPVITEYPLIRLGGNGDGGYLVPDDFNGIDVCFSPGVSNIANFELAMADMGIKCYMADYSVDKPPFENKFFFFRKKFLGVRNDDVFLTLDKWVGETEAQGDDFLLQMDIEGGEYPVILDMDMSLLKRFRILIIEFHDLQMLFDKVGFNLIDLTFHKLLKEFHIVHIHPNNCTPTLKYGKFKVPPVMEFTMIRKDRVKSFSHAQVFPHALDVKNVDYLDDIPLPKCWFL